jgi:hypothetical protein
MKKSRTHARRKSRGPKISRSRLLLLRNDLDGMRNTMSHTCDNFWVISEHDIRETLARTEQKIGRALDMLKTAA